MSFNKLLDVLELEQRKRAAAEHAYFNNPGPQPSLAKSQTLPSFYVEEVEPLPQDRHFEIEFRPPDNRAFHEVCEKFQHEMMAMKTSLAAQQTKTAADNERLCRKRLQKSMPERFRSFNSNLRKAVLAGELTADEAGLLEFKRNQYAAQCAELGLLP